MVLILKGTIVILVKRSKQLLLTKGIKSNCKQNVFYVLRLHIALRQEKEIIYEI